MNLYEESTGPSIDPEGGTFYAEDLVAAREQGRVMAEASHVIRAEEQIWEDSPQGRLKHIAHPKLSANVTDIEAYIQELPPDGRSGKHRHMARSSSSCSRAAGTRCTGTSTPRSGTSTTGASDDAPRRVEWEAGDWMYIPVNTIHQHFNADGEEPARILCASSMLFKWLGWHDLEQLEDAPPSADT